MEGPVVVQYYLDDGSSKVAFEIQPLAGFTSAGIKEVVGPLRDALEPAMQAALIVVERAKSLAPKEVEIKFAVKVSGTMQWFVAKAATEGNFEITLKWAREPKADASPPSVP